MSGTSTGPGDQPLAESTHVEHQPEPDEAVAAVAERAAEAAAQDTEQLGMVTPTWYVLLCALPYASAFLLPVVVIYQRQNAVPPVSASAAAWSGVGVGWLLFLVGTLFWILGKVVLAGPRSRAPHAWSWWDRMTRAWMLVVLAWGVVASLSVLLVSYLIGRLAA